MLRRGVTGLAFGRRVDSAEAANRERPNHPMQDDILNLAYEVSRVTEEKVDLIDTVMRQTTLLAINARIEAARAGASGAAFSVVAQEMGAVARDISRIAQELRGAIAGNIAKLEGVGAELRREFRGARFTDLAHNAIEIVDRNLYERSCDVRWWATDSAVVDAAAREAGPDVLAHATERLATILRSYTVYLDLWVADRHGRVVATGRPHAYARAVGLDVSRTAWFENAMACRSGDDFAVSDITVSSTLGDAAVATYSTAIRQEGRTDGRAIGALGIFFDWTPQASAVVSGLSLSPEERRGCRVMLLDAKHRVIAASNGRGELNEVFPLRTEGRDRGFYEQDGRMIAFALTPGYETYKGLGWYGVIDCLIDEGGLRRSEPALAQAVGF
jgi:hypothetical protein